MARNYTLMHEHPAEFKAAPFARPAWTVGHWQSNTTEPYAVDTIATDLLADGWRELSTFDMRSAFPQGKTGGIPVDRAFVRSEAGSRHGHIVTLTDKRKLTGETTRRVQIPAHAEAWMRGDRFGTVVRVKGDRAQVRLDKSQKLSWMDANDLRDADRS